MVDRVIQHIHGLDLATAFILKSYGRCSHTGIIRCNHRINKQFDLRFLAGCGMSRSGICHISHCIDIIIIYYIIGCDVINISIFIVAVSHTGNTVPHNNVIFTVTVTVQFHIRL